LSEHDNRQFGEGTDNFGQAAKQMADAAKQFGQSGAQNAAAKGASMGAQAATKGAEATANAAAATVKAGVESGKAVAEVASGTAAGGPWGAVIAAAWAMRHTLFKILISACLIMMFLFAMVVNLPTILFNNIFRTDPDTVDMSGSTNMNTLFDELSTVVADCVTAGYDHALAEVGRIISDGGYDYELSMEALINHGFTSADYNISYVLAAYSASMSQRGATREDMAAKLCDVRPLMFAVTYVEREITITVPAEEEGGELTTETIRYVQCTIHPFDQSVILIAFGIDTSAEYNQFNITYGEAIHNMATALRRTMFGNMVGGEIPPITDAELQAFLDNLDTTPARRELMRAALSLVGRVPYFWGGKSSAGWNEAWNTPRLVTAAGSSSSGTVRPFGLDCSGFTDWVYKTAVGHSLHANGSWSQWENTFAITEAELRPGDVGFMARPGTVRVNHVLLYAGTDANGNRLWVHSSSGAGGVVLNAPTYVSYFRRIIGIDLDTMFLPLRDTGGIADG